MGGIWDLGVISSRKEYVRGELNCIGTYPPTPNGKAARSASTYWDLILRTQIKGRAVSHGFLFPTTTRANLRCPRPLRGIEPGRACLLGLSTQRVVVAGELCPLKCKQSLFIYTSFKCYAVIPCFYLYCSNGHFTHFIRRLA